ncbi:MAG: rane-bound lytic murein transglycosylase [Gammaproteobacteria bacterium]|jgi:membrane-bound lytic murein transglycosylase F|nr:rane-bound lytic murein transglycosylase [Gammaproteobacteria bacterium]
MKLTIAVCALVSLSSYAPIPSLVVQIKTLGELRVVTRTSPLAFYRGADGIPEGPEYELAQRFADVLGVKLKITPMHSYAEIYAALTSGQAHLAAAGLKVPMQSVPGIEFGPAYQHVHEHLIYRRGAVRPGSLAEIGNADLEIAAGSSHAKTLEDARHANPELVWVENSSTNSQALLDGVADGTIDYTIADSTEFALAHDAHPDLRIAFDFPGNDPLAWAASSHDPSFAHDMSDYFGHLKSNGDLAVIVNRYYGRSEDGQFAGGPGFMRHLQSRLPLYKEWFVQAAEQSSQDWRLLAAIGYQESKWNPRAASSAGARGLMQLTLETATEAKVTDLSDARQSIFGGARYFRQVYEKIPSHVPEPDRTWFALAAYNIGYGHVEDARVLAQKAGRDPDSWQDVRDFLPLLEQERWYTKTENGYARGWEPVRYVDNVRGYRDMLEWAWGDGPNAAVLN